MQVRTIRKHTNSHKPQRAKSPGRLYDVSEQEAERLIAAGLVEAVEDDEGQA